MDNRNSKIEQLMPYKELLDGAPSGAAIRDTFGRVVYCNNAYARILGFVSPEHALGTTFDDVIPEDSMQQFVADIQPLLFQGPWSGDMIVRRQDGEIRRLNVSTDVIRDSNGKPAAVYSMLTDITERAKTEDALRESEERYRSLAENVDAVVFRADPDFRPVMVMGHPERYGRLTADEYIERPEEWPKSLHPDDRLRVMDSLISIARSGQPEALEIRTLDGAGDQHWMRCQVTPHYDQGGNLAYLDGVAIEITAMKQAEAALRETEEKQRTLIEDARAIIFRADCGLRTVQITGSLETLTGIATWEMLENPELLLESIHPDDRPYVVQVAAEIAEKRQPHSLEFRIQTRSAETLWVRAHLTPRYAGTGELTHYDGVAFDITERMEARMRDAKYTVQMATLAEISRAFASSLDFETILERATEKIAKALACTSVVVSVDQETGRLSHTAAFSKEPGRVDDLNNALLATHLTAETAFGKMGVTPRVTPDLRLLSPELAGFAGLVRVGPAIMAPVVSQGETLCVMTGLRNLGDRPFDEEDLWFITEVASHASAALTNARLYKHQSRIAETLQRSLIPAIPQLDCLDLATAYFPALGEAEVGGDFFDVISLDGGQIGLVVGDVSGKGVEAAIHTAETKYMLRGFARQTSNPAQVMTALNEALCAYISESAFVTLVYLVLDIGAGKITYVNAGHELPMLLCQRTREVRELLPNNPILGVFQGHEFEAHDTWIDGDDFLLCYTDGVTEAPNNGDRFGHERLLDTVAHAPVAHSQDLLDHVVWTVRDFSKGNQPDDQVIVVARPSVSCYSSLM